MPGRLRSGERVISHGAQRDDQLGATP
jgi:hypothetical protein